MYPGTTWLINLALLSVRVSVWVCVSTDNSERGCVIPACICRKHHMFSPLVVLNTYANPPAPSGLCGYIPSAPDCQFRFRQQFAHKIGLWCPTMQYQNKNRMKINPKIWVVGERAKTKQTKTHCRKTCCSIFGKTKRQDFILNTVYLYISNTLYITWLLNPGVKLRS